LIISYWNSYFYLFYVINLDEHLNESNSEQIVQPVKVVDNENHVMLLADEPGINANEGNVSI